jgi:AraC-like DNA-binding protein
MTKPYFEYVQSEQSSSFLLRRFQEKIFTAPYHFHPEYELTLIVQGEGKRFVGNNMESYSAGDLVLLGSNLPHCWKSEQVEASESISESIVIQFSDDFLGKDFFIKKEMEHIRKLFQRSRKGVYFSPSVAKQIEQSLQQMLQEQNTFKKLITFLEVLQELATTSEFKILNQHPTISGFSSSETEKINFLMAFIIENFRGNITLEEISSLANMTPNAFCKYFKRMTRKTLMEVVNEYRLNFAIQQLTQSTDSVNNICYNSGFQDISHFHKLFKKRFKMSPLNYRRKFLKEIVQ